MIDDYELIAELFGKSRSEARPPSTTTSTIMGVAVSDSSLGSVDVELPGDVTGGEGNVVTLPTEAHICEGDVVSVTLVGGVAKAARVTGTVGGGDRTYEYAETAHDAAVQAVADAADAKEAAEAAESDAAAAAQSASQAATSASAAATSASNAESSASTASTAASSAQTSASAAATSASDAAASASSAQSSAASAATSAADAASDAATAQTQAAAATTAANSALTQLSIVEDVAGTLDWISKHGTYTVTSDTTVHDDTVYFEKVGNDYVPIVLPDSTKNPHDEGWYVLDVTDSQSDFIMAHLAVTSRGLWVLPSGIGSSTTPASGETQADSDARQASDYKVLLASDGMYLYDGTGAQVVKYGSTIQFASDRGFAIGDTNGTSYIAFVPGQGIMIGGGVSIGSSKTLSELMAEVDAKAARGTGILKISTAPSSYSTTTGGFTPTYRISLSTVKSEAGVSDVIVGDVLEQSYYHYPVGYVDSSYVYTGERTSIRGATGATGPQGETGANGTSVTITSKEVKYQASTSGTTTPTGTWQTSVPSVAQGSYLWTRTIVNYSTGDSTTSYSVGMMGVNGTNGTNGTSVTVSSTAYAYQLSTSGTTVPTGTWQSTPQAPTTTQYAWTRTTTTFSDGSTATTYTVGGKVGEKGDTGSTGPTAQWYYGTALTHTSGTATLATSSTAGVVVGAMYLNKDTSLCYKCTAISGTTATWTYAGNLTDGVIDNIDIGGRNLLRGTGTFGVSDWAKSGSSAVITCPSPGVLKLGYRGGSDYVKYIVDYLDFADYGDCTVTLSFDAKCEGEDGTSTGMVAYIGFSIASRINKYFTSSYDRYCPAVTFSLTDSWAHYSMTKVIPNDLTSGKAAALVAGSMLSIEFGKGTAVKTYSVKNIKLELGNIATDWTPAPEDTIREAAEASKVATNYITDVSNDGIWVTPSDAKPSSGAAVSTTSGWHISDAIELFRLGVSYIKLWVSSSVAYLRLGLESAGHAVFSPDGMEVFKGGASVASFGDTARVGTASGRNVYIDSDSVDIRSGSTVLADFTGDGCRFISNGETSVRMGMPYDIEVSTLNRELDLESWYGALTFYFDAGYNPTEDAVLLPSSTFDFAVDAYRDSSTYDYLLVYSGSSYLRFPFSGSDTLYDEGTISPSFTNNVGYVYASLTNETSYPPQSYVDIGRFKVTKVDEGLLYAVDAVGDIRTTVNGGNHKLSEKADSVHTHAAGDITSGTFDAARIPTLAVTKVSALVGHAYGTCSTAAATAAKVVTCSGFVRTTGARVAVKFTYANSYTAGNTTLNVNSTGAAAIYVGKTGPGRGAMWSAGDVVEFMFDGTYWQIQGRHAVLYDNSTGTNGTVTFVGSASAANYDHMRIFFRSNDNLYGSVDVYSPSNKYVVLTATLPRSAGQVTVKSASRYIGTTTITAVNPISATDKVTGAEGYISSSPDASSGEFIYITRVEAWNE